MRRIKAEVAIIGNGGTAMLAANRLIGMGSNVVLINPSPDFGVEDLRPRSGLGLWQAAYRAEGNVSLAGLYDELVSRMREVYPATLEQSGLARTENWSILSSTLIHRSVTEELEREFFKIERKPWSSGQFRLVNPEHVLARTRRLGLDLPAVAQIEGGVVRAYGLWWDAAQMGLSLTQFIRNKIEQNSGNHCFLGAGIEGRYGRKIIISTREGEEVSIESERGLLIFLTGELLPRVKSIVAACDEPWIQGVRKRRREQHYVWFERPAALQPPSASGSSPHEEEVWLELGHTRYRWSRAGGIGTWLSEKGPDGLERVVDEGLRLQSLPQPTTRFVHSTRAFRLEWDWKNPQWRATSHDTYWATSFEGELWNIMETLWNLPLH